MPDTTRVKQPVTVYCSECQAHHFKVAICEFRYVLGGWVASSSDSMDRDHGYWRIHCQRRRHPKLNIPMDGRLEHFLDEWDATARLPEFADIDASQMCTDTLKLGVNLTDPLPKGDPLAA